MTDKLQQLRKLLEELADMFFPMGIWCSFNADTARSLRRVMFHSITLTYIVTIHVLLLRISEVKVILTLRDQCTERESCYGASISRLLYPPSSIFIITWDKF
jgi:hypothetical protein